MIDYSSSLEKVIEDQELTEFIDEVEDDEKYLYGEDLWDKKKEMC